MSTFEADKYFKEDRDTYISGRKSSKEDLKEITIRFKPRTVERIILISLILILLGYIVVVNVFYPCECFASQDSITGASVTTQAQAAPIQEATSEETQTQIEPSPTPATLENEDTPQTEVATTEEPQAEAPAETVLNDENDSSGNLVGAELTFGSGNVYLDGPKITKITFQLKNTGDSILRARVDTSWYDDSDTSSLKEQVCGSTNMLVAPGDTYIGEITGFTRKYTNPENSKETVLLKAYDSSTDIILDSAKTTINP